MKYNILDVIEFIITITGTYFTWLVGGWDFTIQFLLLAMILDYIAGMLRAYKTKTLSSDTGFSGITRKFTMLIVVVFAVLLDYALKLDAPIFRNAALWFYIGNEGLSLMENAACLGVPIPYKLKEALIQLRDGNKKELTKQKENEV